MFHEWPDSARVDDTNVLIFCVALPPAVRRRSAGTLPDGLELAEGYGVMESHDVTVVSRTRQYRNETVEFRYRRAYGAP